MVSKRSSLKRWAPAFCLALIASLLLSGLAAGSASAAPQHWYSCNDTGVGKYTDGTCQTEGAGGYGWVELSSTPSSFTLKGSTFTMTATLGGASGTLSCANAGATGTLANPSGAVAGTLSTEAASSLLLSGCEWTLKTGKACGLIAGGGNIQFVALSGEALEQADGSRVVNLQPASGTTLATFAIDPGVCYKNKVNVTLSGSFRGIVNPASSSLEFTEASSGTAFKANGATAKLVGTTSIDGTAEHFKLKLDVTGAPVNTVLPTVPTSNPTVGTTLTSTTGTWTNSPTSYSYQWSRCTAAGTECLEIMGATSSTYTTAANDEGETFVIKVTATNASGSTPATSAPSQVVDAAPSSEPRHWYACEHVGEGGGYSAGCGNVNPAGEYKWVKLKEGSPLSFTSTNTTPIKISMTVGEATTTIECSTESGAGTVTNPVGGGAGTFTGTNKLLALSGCKVVKGCSVISGGAIGSESVTGKTTESKIALTGVTLFDYTLTTCLAAHYTVSGTLNGTVNSVSSSLVFDSTSGKELKNSGANTWLEGSIRLKTEEGLLRFKP